MTASMRRLASKVMEQFSQEAIIEIYVLDEEGRPCELYSGLPSGLTPRFFQEILTKPATFYCFSVVGIDETFADLLDIHRDKMSRKEFCWLTDPLPPILENRTDTSISISIRPVDFCGVDVSVVEDEVEYVLEGCQGRPWTPGLASKFVSDIANPEYKLIARGKYLRKVTVNDLRPSHWYHFRVSIHYAGTCVTSESRPFATLTSRPSKPKQPSVFLVVNGNDMFQHKNRVDPQIRLSWGAPVSNGAEIKKYHVQVREFVEETLSEAMSSIAMKEDSNIFDGTETIEKDSDDVLVNEDGIRLVAGKWETKYCNLLNQVVLPQPSAAARAWSCRMRALNGHGWSEFSDPMILDFVSHPKLFKSTQPVSPRQLPPIGSNNSTATEVSKASGEISMTSSHSSIPHTCDEKPAPSLLLPPGSPALSCDGLDETRWMKAYPDKKMEEVIEPEVDVLWKWTNMNKDFIRYVVSNAVCDNGG